MFTPLICHGCGRRLEVEPGSRQRKVQCPDCGVYCEVPAGAAPLAKTEAKKAPPKPASKTVPKPSSEPVPKPPAKPARKFVRASSSAIQSDPPEAVEFVLLEATPTTRKNIFLCPKCGETIRLTGKHPGRPEPCPCCGADIVCPSARERLQDPDILPEPVSPIAEVLPRGTEADDGNPYAVEGGPEYKCPGCLKRIKDGAAFCVHCGLDFETGRKAERSYQKIKRFWESGLSFRIRLYIFIAWQALFVLVVLPGALMAEGLRLFVPSYICITAMLSFVLGTFSRIDLSRNERGKVVLTQTWRACFIPMPTTPIPWRTYEGVASGIDRDAGFWEWLIFFILLCNGIIPGVIWYFAVIYRDTFYAALCKHHGFPELTLYRGNDQAKAKEMAVVISDVSGLPIQGVHDPRRRD